MKWPELDWSAWSDTAATLQLWTQIVGKTRLELTPLLPQWWNVTLYVTARGLSTSAMFAGDDLLEVEFDFHRHQLLFRHSANGERAMPLAAQTVASFYADYQRTLKELGVLVHLNPKPQELKDAVPFDQDTTHPTYDPDYALRFWRVLASSVKVMDEYASGFEGKQSPAHFFWGSFDLAITRFNGKKAPPRKGVITREAYSHEVISAGFWPGNGGYGEAAFYAYAAPSPQGLSLAKVEPSSAGWDAKLGEFVWKYHDMRREKNPDAALRDFLETTYAAAADAAGWDRDSLERR